MNKITLYNNGTGVFERAYTLSGGVPLKLSLPIRNDSLDEVVASIGVFGDVTLTAPPSYTPIGTDATNLEIDAYNVVRDLATRLRGARVSVLIAAESVTGRVAGIQTFQEIVGDTAVERYQVALFDEAGALRTFADREIVALTFTDAAVQAEIDKALQRAFETIKPNSTFVNLTLTPNSEADTPAMVQYAVAQLGAWKISYRLRSEADAWALEGQAVVDNSTEEPWDDCLISVVTGEPISFSTDLAEIRVVRRSKVNVVADQALGSVSVQEPVALFDIIAAMPEGGAPRRAQMARSSGVTALAETDAVEESGRGLGRVRQAEAEAREVGDSVEYTSPHPVSIGANRSAIIPLFEADLKHSVRLLVYKPEEHAERPYRALRFRNETAQSLGRGVCTLFEEGMYVGKAILEATKPGEERTLVYALETGVRVNRDSAPLETHRTGVRIGEGIAVSETLLRGRTIYTVKNNRPTPFTLEIEHARLSPQESFSVSVAPQGEARLLDIPDGVRIGVDLPAQGALKITVVGTRLQSRRTQLRGAGGLAWLLDNVVSTLDPLNVDPTLRVCIARQADVDAAKRNVDEVSQQVQDLLEEQERLKGLLQAGGHEGAANEWRTTLAQNERKIKELKAQLPALRTAIQTAETALQQALAALTLTVEEPPAGSVAVDRPEESKESKEPTEPKESKESKEPTEPKESKESKEPTELKESKESKEPTEPKGLGEDPE